MATALADSEMLQTFPGFPEVRHRLHSQVHLQGGGISHELLVNQGVSCSSGQFAHFRVQ